jgi:hypothetical protein
MTESRHRKTFAVVVGIVSVLGAGCAGKPRSDPRATATTVVGYSDLYLSSMIDCLAVAGVTASTLPGRGIGFQVPPEQADLARSANSKCEAEMKQRGLVPEPTPLTEQQLRDTFQKGKTIAACLTSNGFEVDPIPSFDSFRDSKGGNWDPSGALFRAAANDPNRDGSAIDRAQQLCPGA